MDVLSVDRYVIGERTYHHTEVCVTVRLSYGTYESMYVRFHDVFYTSFSPLIETPVYKNDINLPQLPMAFPHKRINTAPGLHISLLRTAMRRNSRKAIAVMRNRSGDRPGHHCESFEVQIGVVVSGAVVVWVQGFSLGAAEQFSFFLRLPLLGASEEATAGDAVVCECLIIAATVERCGNVAVIVGLEPVLVEMVDGGSTSWPW